MLVPLARILAQLPLNVRRKLGALGGWIFSFLPTSDREVAVLQMKHALGDKAPHVSKVYANIGLVALEAFNMCKEINTPHILAQVEKVKAVMRDHPEKASFVILSGHIGNWELLAASLQTHGVPLALIGRTAKKPSWQVLVQQVRSQYGAETIWRSDPKGARIIIDSLRGGRRIGVLLDQDLKMDGIFVPFFGKPCWTATRLIELIKRQNCGLITCLTTREKDGTYTYHPEYLDINLPTDQILTEYHRRLELLIRQYPEQWVWFHKRWRTQQDGNRYSGVRYLQFLRESLGFEKNA